MAKPHVLQSRWSLGMRQDEPRHQMRGGAAWNIVDLFPDQGAPLRKRGGYAWASPDLDATNAGSTYVVAGIHAPYAAGTRIVIFDEDGQPYYVQDASTVTDIGTAHAPVQNPVFHNNLIVIPSADGGSTSYIRTIAYDGATWTITQLGATSPPGQYAAVFSDYTVLANSDANPRRLWFSDPGDPTTWDLTDGWLDTSYAITGLAALRNALLIFSTDRIERFRATDPPPGQDFVLEPMFEVGTTDARSIALWGDVVVFANPNGIYMTDGSAQPLDLTAEAGMKRYWLDLFSDYSSTWTIAGGVQRDTYVVSVMDGATFKDAFRVDLRRRTIIRVSNLKAVCFFPSIAAADELYAGLRGITGASRLASLSSFYSPAAGVKNDADGTAVTPVLETGFYRDDPSEKSWIAAYFGYHLTDAGTDNPTLALSYATDVAAASPSYTAVATLSETTAYDRTRKRLTFGDRQVAFKVAQTNASAETMIFDIEAEIEPREGSR